jgi:hypothetical protein
MARSLGRSSGTSLQVRGVFVRIETSLIIVGTEKLMIETGKKSLLG